MTNKKINLFKSLGILVKISEEDKLISKSHEVKGETFLTTF